MAKDNVVPMSQVPVRAAAEEADHLPMVAPEQTFEMMIKMGDSLVKTGFLPESITSGAQAAAIILAGRELGIGTMEALRSINVIKGKPTIPPQLMLALAYRRIPGFKASRVSLDNDKAVWKFQRPGGDVHVETFTIRDATDQGLTGKYNWKSMRQIMLDWRCIAAGMRRVAPDVVLGLYTPEEMSPDVRMARNEQGEAEMVMGQADATVLDPEPYSGDPEQVIPPDPTPDIGTQADEFIGGFEEEAAPEPEPEPEPKKAGTITEKQKVRMFAIAKGTKKSPRENPWTDDQMKAYLNDFGFVHSTDITKDLYDAIIEKFQSDPPEAE